MRAQELQNILRHLGDTPQTVAAKLKANGVKGVRNTLRHLNPIVRYVERQLLLDDYQLSLEQPKVDSQLMLLLVLPNGESQETMVKGAIKQFLDGFNRGDFPDLELTSFER
jgi:hypothetical protein